MYIVEEKFLYNLANTILFVGNDKVITPSLHQIFNSHGFLIKFAIEKEFVIKEIQNDTIGLILFDLDLGIAETGISLAQEILSLTNIPILFLSSNSEKELLLKVENVFSYGLLDKNASATSILFSIKTALRFHQEFLELKKREKYLVENVNLLQNILDCSTDYIFVKDLELRTILCNDMVAKAVGKKAADLIGHNDIENGVPIELVKGNPEKGIRGYENDDLAALRGETISNPTDYVYATDGTVYVYDTIKRPLRDKSGEIIGLLGISRDVTEKVKLEATIQRNQKLESIGILAGGIAHDFNNLLAGIFGYIEIALNLCPENSNITLYLKKALSAFNRAKALTIQLLTFSKGGAPIKKIVNLKPLLMANVQFSLSGSNISVHYDIEDELWMTEVDENQVGQVIDNIVINAIQAMPAGGNIVVTAKNTIVSSKQLPIHQNTENRFVKISLKDSGIGIPKDLITRIFDPFFSTKQKGTGLGLSTAFSIIQKHGGFIDVESTVGVGSTFLIYLPASDKQMTEVFVLKEIKNKSNAKVLFMDDEIYIQEIESMRLKSMGYSVSVASNGDEAISLFKESEFSDSPFNIVILDLTIPGGKGGIKTLEEIRKINFTVPVIIASGYSESPAIANPEEYGFNDSLEKPYSMEKLLKVLNKFLFKRFDTSTKFN